MRKIKVLVVEPNLMPYEKEIDNTLEVSQSIVDGYIEIICPFEVDEDIVLVCNEEGKISGLPYNRALWADGKKYDYIAGTFFLAGRNEEGDFISLTEKQKGICMAAFGDI